MLARWVEETESTRKKTYVIPIPFGELKRRSTPLYACTVDENMDLAIHDIKCLLEDTFDRLWVRQVAVHDLETGGGALVTNGVDNRQILGSNRRTDKKTERSASLRQSESTGSTDSWRRVSHCAGR